jgi:hypothetical protein
MVESTASASGGWQIGVAPQEHKLVLWRCRQREAVADKLFLPFGTLSPPEFKRNKLIEADDEVRNSTKKKEKAGEAQSSR